MFEVTLRHFNILTLSMKIGCLEHSIIITRGSCVDTPRMKVPLHLTAEGQKAPHNAIII